MLSFMLTDGSVKSPSVNSAWGLAVPSPTTICNTFWERGEYFLHHLTLLLACFLEKQNFQRESVLLIWTVDKLTELSWKAFERNVREWEQKEKKRQMKVSIFSNSLHSRRQKRQKNHRGLWRQRDLGLFPAPPSIYLADLGKFLNLYLNFPIWRTVVSDTCLTELMEEFKEIIQEKWLEHHRCLTNISFLLLTPPLHCCSC